MRTRPRLMGAKIVAALMRKFMPFMPNKNRQASMLKRLEDEIRDKQKAAPKEEFNSATRIGRGWRTK